MWSIDNPTWREQGPGLWAQLAQLARPDAPAPRDARVRAAARRNDLTEAIAAELAADPDQEARFRRRVERLASYVPVREERAHWQLLLVGAMRHAALRRGDALVGAGRLDQRGDVLFCLPAEIDDERADLRGLAVERRDEHTLWRARRPPLLVGGSTGDAEFAQPADGTVRGHPASRGTVTGRARIVVDLVDADRLEPGDVLVCTMTSPPWTSLFGVAAAVVTDSGDIGSHPSIAAREYGIPCVVGTGSATTLIPDGATVTVDGTKGIVRIA
jgi:phosphohistidine swiveling domain-containing protein